LPITDRPLIRSNHCRAQPPAAQSWLAARSRLFANSHRAGLPSQATIPPLRCQGAAFKLGIGLVCPPRSYSPHVIVGGAAQLISSAFHAYLGVERESFIIGGERLLYFDDGSKQIRATSERWPGFKGVGLPSHSSRVEGGFRPMGCRRSPSCFRFPSATRRSDDGLVPVICPTCQNVFAGSPKASMPATPRYFAWGCFRYFGRERAPRRPWALELRRKTAA
jgi:hypothetical protein